MTKQNQLEKTAGRWNEQTKHKRAGRTWTEAGPEIEQYINRRISGDPTINWIEYAVNKYCRQRERPIHCLSLGCGNGGLERAIAKLDGFDSCDAYDLAEERVKTARQLAESQELRHITYHVADVNAVQLQPNRYDAVWINMALHHFESLEHICQQIQQSLKQDGVLILQEYIGPNRFQFPERQKEIANLCLRLLPPEYRAPVPAAVTRILERSSLTHKGPAHFISRTLDKVKDGDLLGAVRRRAAIYRTKWTGQTLQKNSVNFPTAQSVAALDPSEAIRSAEIVTVMGQFFEIVEKKDWGGNLLHFLLADIAGNFADGRENSTALLKMLINIEETLLDCGEFESDFSYIVARPLSN